MARVKLPVTLLRLPQVMVTVTVAPGAAYGEAMVCASAGGGGPSTLTVFPPLLAT